MLKLGHLWPPSQTVELSKAEMVDAVNAIPQSPSLFSKLLQAVGLPADAAPAAGQSSADAAHAAEQAGIPLQPEVQQRLSWWLPVIMVKYRKERLDLSP